MARNIFIIQHHGKLLVGDMSQYMTLCQLDGGVADLYAESLQVASAEDLIEYNKRFNKEVSNETI